MSGLRSWLGLPEEDQSDPVQRTLEVLGQGAASAGQALSDVGSSIGSAVSDVGSRLTAPPTAGFPEVVQQPFETTAAERLYQAATPANVSETLGAAAGAAGTAAYEAADLSDPTNRQLATASFPAYAGRVVEAALPTFGGEVGARVARTAAGPEAGPYATIPESVPLVGGQQIGPEEVGRFVGGGLTDPLSYLGVPGAARAGHLGRGVAEALPVVGEALAGADILGAAARGGAGLVRRGAGAVSDWGAANAERLAAADARMAAQPGTVAPSVFGMLPEGAPNIEARIAGAESALDAARARLDDADALVARAENGPPAEFNAARQAYGQARQDYGRASDAVQALHEERRAIGGRIEEAGYGRPVEDAGIQTTAQPRDVRSGEVVPPYRLEGTPSVSLNAGFGTVPADKSGRRWVADARYQSGGYWWTPSRIANADEVRAGILQRADLREAERLVADANGAWTTARIERADVERQLARAPDDPELLQNLMGAIRHEEELQGRLDAAREWHQMVQTGDRTLAITGVAPDLASPDRLAVVNRILGQALASSVSGGVGAQVNQQLNPDDPYAGLKGFAAGALVPAGSVMAARRLSRLAGAEARGAEGALATLFPPAGGGPQNLPHLQRALARGQGTPSAPGLTPWQYTKGLASNAMYSALLGPATATMNLAQGAWEPALAVAREPVRGVVRAAQTGSAQALREPGEMAKGAAYGLTQLGSELVDVIAGRGRYAAQPGQPLPLSQKTQNPVGRLVAAATEAPGRVFAGLPDALIGTILTHAGDRREAAQMATDAGLSGGAWTEEVGRLVSEARAAREGQSFPSAEAQQVIEAGDAYAKRHTLRRDLGEAGKLAKDLSLANIPYLGKWATPFFDAPWNAGLRAMELTPGGALMNTQPSRVDKYFDATVGSAIVLGLATAGADTALVTGSGPDDPALKQMLRDQGWRPYTTRVRNPLNGERYYLPNRVFGPFETALNAVGEIGDGMRYGKPDATTNEQVDAVTGRLGQLIRQNPYAASGVVSILDLPQGGAAGFLADQLGRATPGAATGRAIGTALDPYERTTDRGKNVPYPTQIGERWEQSVGLRGDLPVAQTALGAPRENERAGPWAFLPQITREQTNPIEQELLANRVGLSQPPAALGGEAMRGVPEDLKPELTPDEQRRWSTLRGEAITRSIQAALANERYQQAGPEGKKAALEALRQAAAEEAHGRLAGELGKDEIGRRLAERRARKAP